MPRRFNLASRLAGAVVAIVLATIHSARADGPPPPFWPGYAGDPQHTAISSVASQDLQTIRWQTPVDLDPQYSGSELLIHYGSPTITAANTAIVPVKMGADGNFEVTALNGANGSSVWSATSDYILPSHDWTPSFSPAITPSNRVYYPGPGGTVYYRDNADSPTGASGQIAFFGTSAYNADPTDFNNNVFINTPITSDSAGNIYFGFRVTGTTPVAGLTSGIARIGADGSVTFVSAATASNNATGITTPVMNCSPALSTDGSTLYMTVSTGNSSIAATGDLVALNSQTLATKSVVALVDPNSGKPAWLPDDGTASPTVGPDGHVFIGVLENPFPSNNDRGWMLQFSGDLSSTKTPGAFGWDDTASIVPAKMVPSYTGSSKYLILTKYNNYAGVGSGDGVNKVAILDPGDTEIDPVTGATVMKEILTVTGPTSDSVGGFPNAVKEWCINSAAVDPATDSVLINSEDGTLYRWNLITDTLSQSITLTDGLGEAYTPTLIGADGSVYAISDGILFNVGAVPEPASAGLIAVAAAMLLNRRRPR